MDTLFGHQNLGDIMSNHMLTLDDITFHLSNTVKNLGVIVDQDLSFNSYIKEVFRTAFFNLRKVKLGLSCLKVMLKE